MIHTKSINSYIQSMSSFITNEKKFEEEIGRKNIHDSFQKPFVQWCNHLLGYFQYNKDTPNFKEFVQRIFGFICSIISNIQFLINYATKQGEKFCKNKSMCIVNLVPQKQNINNMVYKIILICQQSNCISSDDLSICLFKQHHDTWQSISKQHNMKILEDSLSQDVLDYALLKQDSKEDERLFENYYCFITHLYVEMYLNQREQLTDKHIRLYLNVLSICLIILKRKKIQYPQYPIPNNEKFNDLLLSVLLNGEEKNEERIVLITRYIMRQGFQSIDSIVKILEQKSNVFNDIFQGYQAEIIKNVDSKGVYKSLIRNDFIKNSAILLLLQHNSKGFYKQRQGENLLTNIKMLTIIVISFIFKVHKELAKFLRSQANIQYDPHGQISDIEWIDNDQFIQQLPCASIYFDTLQFLWDFCDTRNHTTDDYIVIEHSYSDVGRILDLMEQFGKSGSPIEQRLNFIKKRSDPLFICFSKCVASNPRYSEQLDELEYQNIDFAQRKMLLPYCETLEEDKQGENIHMSIDRNNILQSLCQQFELQKENISDYVNSFFITLYVEQNDEIIEDDGVDEGGITRYVLQECLDQSIYKMKFLKRTQCGQYYFDDKELKTQEDMEQVRLFAQFIAMLPLQEQLISFPIKEELLIYLKGYDIIPFKNYCNSLCEQEQKMLQYLKITQDPQYEEMWAFSNENHQQIFYENGKKILDIIRTYTVELWSLCGVNIDKVIETFNRSIETKTYEQIQQYLRYEVQGLDNEQRSLESKNQLIQISDQKFALLNEILRGLDQENLLKFIKLTCGSIFNIQEMIVIFVDNDMIPNWLTCSNTFFIGNNFDRIVFEKAMSNVDGFALN